MQKIKNTSQILAFGCFLLSNYTSLFCQISSDTLYINAYEAENTFLKNNVLLLAEKLSIDQADAKILQAKAWPNPTFTLDELQVYKNATTDDIPPIFGEFWRDRNFAMQLDQWIITAGKRRKAIQVEKYGKEMAEYVFMDVLQALKSDVRQTISEIIYLQQVQNSWKIQLIEIQKLIQAQTNQFKEGHLSQAELYRLKALQISLQGELNQLNESMTEQQRNLKNLLGSASNVFVVITNSFATESIQKLKQKTLAQCMELSQDNAQLKIAGSLLKMSETNFSLEKANRVPNLQLITSYDRNGSTMRNFIGVGLSMDIPVLDKNRGNIQAAKLEVEKVTYLQKNTEIEVANHIVKIWEDIQQSIALYQSIDIDYIQKLDQLTLLISENFSQKNISMLEFLDYYESFRDSKEKYFEAIKTIVNKKEELIYLIGNEL